MLTSMKKSGRGRHGAGEDREEAHTCASDTPDNGEGNTPLAARWSPCHRVPPGATVVPTWIPADTAHHAA